MCHIVSFIGHLRSGRLEVTFCSLVVNFHLGGHVCFGSVTLDLRKIPQSGDMSHRGFIRIVQTFELFGHLRIGKLEVLVFSLPCLVSVTLDLRKIPHSGVLSYRGFIRIVWAFQNWNVRMFYFVFGKNLTERGYITSGVIVFFRTGCRFSSWNKLELKCRHP